MILLLRRVVSTTVAQSGGIIFGLAPLAQSYALSFVLFFEGLPPLQRKVVVLITDFSDPFLRSHLIPRLLLGSQVRFFLLPPFR